MKLFEKQEIDDAMTELILNLCPDVAFIPMYGGLIIEAVAGNSASRIGGYFFYSAHMSLEFTNGMALTDPEGVLEGKGKYRRHIKIRNRQEIESKYCRKMLIQALAKLRY